MYYEWLIRYYVLFICAVIGYLFEGHLTVDPEPPQPLWLQQTNLMHAVASLIDAESSGGSVDTGTASETASTLLQNFMDNLDSVIPEVLVCLLFNMLKFT